MAHVIPESRGSHVHGSADPQHSVASKEMQMVFEARGDLAREERKELPQRAFRSGASE